MHKHLFAFFGIAMLTGLSACAAPLEQEEESGSTSSAVVRIPKECSVLSGKHVASATYLDALDLCRIDACEEGWGNASETFTRRLTLDEQAADGCEARVTSATVAKKTGEFNLDGELCGGYCEGVTYYERGTGDTDFVLKGRDTTNVGVSMWVEINVLHDKNIDYDIVSTIGAKTCRMHEKQGIPGGSLVWENVWLKLPDRPLLGDDTTVTVSIRYRGGQTPTTDGSYSVNVAHSTPAWLDEAEECAP